MSAMVASSLNPEAPLFIPAALQQVEDFSPQWWDLVKSSAWFRDHWYHQHQQLDDMADSLIAFEAEDAIAVEASQPQPQPPAALKIGFEEEEEEAAAVEAQKKRKRKQQQKKKRKMKQQHR
ncbi:hypothetical protein CFC21_006052 [Triticum aestivum]|uniref:Ataxin-2 C-terminal domain-containing protein n=2 Tax=Triticum aestivum TaxID=4565 RepID=A0A9R1DAY8_WHEAT|nr:hypothetical protein CFC21_006052 [Triticum aestivum]